MLTLVNALRDLLWRVKMWWLGRAFDRLDRQVHLRIVPS